MSDNLSQGATTMKKQKSPFSKPQFVKPVPAAADVSPTEPAAPALANGEFAIEPGDAVIVQLANERLMNAQLHMQNRQNELNSLLAQVRAKYEEAGKYTMSSIDIGRGVIVRTPRES
jgi:hypothetical protein